jgi:hypothetical protein
VLDVTGIGTDRRAAECLDEFFPILQPHFAARSIRIARVLVPRRLARGMAKILPRMTEITQRYAQFVYRIRS